MELFLCKLLVPIHFKCIKYLVFVYQILLVYPFSISSIIFCLSSTFSLSLLMYQVPGFNCDFVYIGQTKRDRKKPRLAEHKLAIKNQEPEKSALCEHSIQFYHLIDWINSKVLKTEARYSKRLTSEAWFINSHPHVMNRAVGDSQLRVTVV